MENTDKPSTLFTFPQDTKKPKHLKDNYKSAGRKSKSKRLNSIN